MSEVSHLHADPSHKKVALLIAILALILAFVETLAKGAQTNALSANVEAANLWSFLLPCKSPSSLPRHPSSRVLLSSSG